MSKISVAEITPEQTKRARLLLISAWSLSTATVLASFFAWGSDYAYKVFPINTLQLFPLLGLMAFGLMWAHYMVGAVRELAGLTLIKNLGKYFQYTGYAVLLLICLHPGLLIYQRFRDGFGLPPGSYESYVAPGLGWVTLLGSVSFLIFIAFEFRRFFSQKSWWHFIPEAGDFAMLAILYHGFRLGGELRMPSWFRVVWLLYAATLIAVLGRSYRIKLFNKV